MKNKILFLVSNQSDWQNISATNPIDEISLTLNDTPDLLIKFVNKHKGKFIAGYISYEFGAIHLGVPVHDLNGIPAAHFYAFETFQNIEEICFINFLRNFSQLNNVIILDPDISAFDIIKNSKAIISLPFTSTSDIEVYYKKPTVFYDPVKLIDMTDHAAREIQIINDKEILLNWIKNFDIVALAKRRKEPGL